MGSKVTADERIVRLILSACKKHGLFYLDSKTNLIVLSQKSVKN